MEFKKIDSSNSRMQVLFSGYNRSSGSSRPLEDNLQLKEENQEADILKEEILKLKLKQLRLVTQNLSGMGLYGIYQLERKMMEGLKLVKDKKVKKEADVDKNEILKLKLKELQLLLKDLSGMGLYEVEQVERELNKGLLSVWATKNQLRLEQMEQPKAKVGELAGSRSATARRSPICFGYYPEQHKATTAKKSDSPRGNIVYAGDVEIGYYSDKGLYLWHYSSLVFILTIWCFIVCLAMLLF